jgi:hypothetical protein
MPQTRGSFRRGGGKREAAAFAFLLATAILVHASPPPLLLSGRPASGGIVLRAAVPPGAESSAQRQATLEALARGLRAEIVFQIRVYAPSRGLTAFLGDRLVSESTISRAARWDPFAELYVIQEDLDGDQRELTRQADGQELLDAFFLLELDVPVPPPSRPGEAAYVTGRYRLTPIRLDGILGIVALFTDLGSRTSEWSRLDVGASP